ncbi:MAG: tetratricopeptide repeat protein [Candidatus Saccharicenans sp.]
MKMFWKKKMFIFSMGAFIFILLFIISFLTAQAQVQGKVRGIVTDAQGNPLEKVAVSIISVRTASQKYETSTGKDGRFAQIGIQPGYYQIIFKKDGFIPKAQEIHVEIASDTNLEIKMETADQVAIKNLSAADKAFVNATNLYNKKNYQEAVAGFEEAIKLNPGNWAYYFNLGLALKKMNKTEEAKAAFKKAVELNPESFSANKEMAELLAKDGDFSGAAEYYKKAVALSPSDADAHYNLAVCLVNIGESGEALGHFQKTIELKPDYAEAYFQLGSIYISQNKTKEAIENLQKFLELAPQNEKAALAKQLLEYLKK